MERRGGFSGTPYIGPEPNKSKKDPLTSEQKLNEKGSKKTRSTGKRKKG